MVDNIVVEGSLVQNPLEMWNRARAAGLMVLLHRTSIEDLCVEGVYYRRCSVGVLDGALCGCKVKVKTVDLQTAQ